MSRFSFLIASALLLAQPVHAVDKPVQAADQPASAASAKELVSLMQGRKAYEGVLAQMDSMMDASMKQAAEGRQLTPEQQKVVDEMRAKMVALVKESMNWDSLEPRMEEIYQKSFSQSEMDGMLRFYKSPTGKAVLAKMPVVMQNTMQIMQGVMQDMIPKIRQIVQETASRVQALDKKAADSPSPGNQPAPGQ